MLATVLLTCGSLTAQEPVAATPLDSSRPITYFIASGDPGSKFRESDTNLAEWALENWERGSNGALRFTPAAEADALIRIHWVPANLGLYGETRSIRVAGRRGAVVYIRPDTDALGEDIAARSRDDSLFRDTIVYLTCLHELGHALGLEHSADFEDIMYFFGYGGDILEYFERYRRLLRSRDDIATASGLSATDVARLGALYLVR